MICCHRGPCQAQKNQDCFRKHQLQTVCVDKTALSAYDDKRYINGDRTTTLPFGHFSLRDEYLTKKICEDSDWGVDSDEDVNVFNIPEVGEASCSETPDPKFNQRSYSNEEIINVVDLSDLSELSDETDQKTPNPFILTESVEEERAITTPSTSDDHLPLSIVKQRKQKKSELTGVGQKTINQTQKIQGKNTDEEAQSNDDDSPVNSDSN